MASEITHVVYGKKIFDRDTKGLDWEKFVIGALFPDIRYRAKIDRVITHQIDTEKEKMPTKDSFKAGLYSHLLVDDRRESFIKRKGIYDLLPRSRYNTTALKLIEDELVYNSFLGWSRVINALNKVLDEEVDYGIKKETVISWHKFLQKYFEWGPNERAWKNLIIYLGFDTEAAMEIIKQVRQVKKKKKVLDIIGGTIDAI